MRNLNRKQKNSLRRYVKARWFENDLTKPTYFNCVQDLTVDFYDYVFGLNRFECFDSCVDRFMNDIKTVNDCKVV
jgi:hypothetical protein